MTEKKTGSTILTPRGSAAYFFQDHTLAALPSYKRYTERARKHVINIDITESRAYNTPNHTHPQLLKSRNGRFCVMTLTRMVVGIYTRAICLLLSFSWSSVTSCMYIYSRWRSSDAARRASSERAGDGTRRFIVN